MTVANPSPSMRPVSIVYGDGFNLDAFGRLRTANPVGYFENKNIHSRNESQWEEPIVGAIIVHGTVTGGPFQVAETITGGTSGQTGTVTAVNAGALTITYNVNHNDFEDGETITGGTSGATATVTTHNTGSHISFDRNTASVVIQTGLGATDSATRQSHRYIPYIPGKSQKVSLTFVFGEAVANVTRRAGYFDDNNGIFFEQTLTGVSFNIRSGVTGSPVTTSVAQADWNIDTMDGTGPSKRTLDFSKVMFVLMDFQWQGTGRVRFGFFIDGAIYYVHQQSYSNNSSTVYMSTPSLPVSYQQVNTGVPASVVSMSEICSSVVSEGGERITGLGFSVSHEVASVAVTTERPVLAIRLKATHPKGGANRMTAQFINGGVFATTNGCHYEFRHLHDPTGITATWQDVGESSGVEYSVDISAVTGNPSHKIEEGYVAAGQAGKGGSESSVIGSESDLHRFITQNSDSNNGEMFVIYATALTGTSNVYGHFTWVEFE